MIRNWCAVFGSALSVVALCSVQVFADDSALSGIGGGAVAPMAQHQSVRMVSETVTVRMTDEDAKVHCVFLFKNEGKACVVKMGFPEKTWNLANGEGGGQSLSGFRSWVDGKPVKCIYSRGKTTKIANADRTERDNWYVKNVPFAAGQTRTVVDDYSTGLSRANNSSMTGYETPVSFTYILRTGRNWKGPIGKAKIVVDISRVPEQYDILPNPSADPRDRHAMSWAFTNFEPTDDISIDLMPRYPSLNGKTTSVDQSVFDDPSSAGNPAWTPFYRASGVTMTGTGFLEQLGANVELDEDRKFCLIDYAGHSLRLVPGSKTAILDGSRIKLQAAPSAEHYPIAIPTASVVRALGGQASYSQRGGRLLVWLKDLSRQGH